jgi:endonuclease YncB( thermonuclease family)
MPNPYSQPIMRDVMARGLTPDMMTDEEQYALKGWKPTQQDPLKYHRPLPKGPVLTDEPVQAFAPPSTEPVKDPDEFVVKPEWKSDSDEFTPPGRRGAVDMAGVQVASVYDGDTFTIRTPSGEERKIRITGIDAPELGVGGLGERERAALSQILKRGNIQISNAKLDPRTGRYNAQVSVEGIPDVGAYMLQNGYAKPQHSKNAPAGWPASNEWRWLWKQIPAQDYAKYKDLAHWSQAYGRYPSMQRGPAYEAFKNLQNEFMQKYGPLLQKHRESSNPKGPAPAALQKYFDDTFGAIGARPEVPTRQEPKTVEAYEPKDAPHGRHEFAAWEKTLNPKEKALYYRLKGFIEKYKLAAPSASRREYFEAPQFVQAQRWLEELIDKTTTRWRAMPPPPSRGGGRRRRSRVSEDTSEALGATV